MDRVKILALLVLGSLVVAGGCSEFKDITPDTKGVGAIMASTAQPTNKQIIAPDISEEDREKLAASVKWVFANGANVSGSRYGDLIAKTIPDLQGMFLRGIDLGGEEGPGRQARRRT